CRFAPIGATRAKSFVTRSSGSPQRGRAFRLFGSISRMTARSSVTSTSRIFRRLPSIAASRCCTSACRCRRRERWRGWSTRWPNERQQLWTRPMPCASCPSYFDRRKAESRQTTGGSHACYSSDPRTRDCSDPALIRYKYPMTGGATWSESVRDLNKPPGPYGPIRVHATVGGYETVSTPAGSFDAIKLRYLIQLDDETFWRYPTQCDYVVWYAPSIGAMVREQKRSYYIERSVESAPQVPGQNAVIELTSFTRGR